MCVTIQVQTATSHQPFHTLAYVCHYPGADCHQSSTIPPWPMCVTIQGQTATSHQPFHPGLCVSLSRGRLSPVINHSTLMSLQGPPWLSHCLRPGLVVNNRCDKYGVHGQLTPWIHTTGSTEPFWCLPLWPYVWSSTGTSLTWGLHQGVAQLQQEGFPRLKLGLNPPCGYLSGIYSICYQNKMVNSSYADPLPDVL